MYQNKRIRVFVRNKARYNPASNEYGFLHVVVVNYAGTTIGNIKENVKKQYKNSLKMDDLFLNNEKLADDRSVAHYNFEDGTILEATSNPFWVSCLFIKQYEVEQIQTDNPNNEALQKWTTKSKNRKKTLLSVLLNSKNEYRSQPPHFVALNDFVIYLERLNKKGARMNPLFSQHDLQQMHEDFLANYMGQSKDPLGAFIEQHSRKLGLKQPENGGPQNPADNGVQVTVRNNPGPVGKVDNRQKHVNVNPGRRRKKVNSFPSLEDDDVITISLPNSPEKKKPHLNFPSSFGTSCSQLAGCSSINQWSTSPLKKRSSDSQSTSSSQIQSSQISGNMSNATCGSCKEKGHNRKWVHCPNFHSFEETQRRRKQELEAKKRVEEREKRAEETKEELERHKTNLELIAAQIEQEKNGLDQTIKKMNKKGKKGK